MAKVEVIPKKLLWVDLEMTGLNPSKDVILEVAAEVTDLDFKTLDSYEALVKHPRQKLVELFQANIFYRDEAADNRAYFLKNLDKALTSKAVEEDFGQFIDKNFATEPAILAGNSIHNDRNFIKYWWPAVDMRLHYRMVDVSSLKVLMQAKFGVIYDKKNSHRAFDDIQASIAELQFYLEWFKNN